ncbi:hypothetical protein MAHJHV28_46100 [Mycobacterium avium subsp. hominissuis]
MCTPLSHAGAAFFVPTIIKGGELDRGHRGDRLRGAQHTRDLSSLETVYYGASAMNPVRLAEAP